MDGLEAIEIQYSYLRTLKTMRIDNEYFSKRYIENEVLLQKFGYKLIGEIVGTITDFGAYSQTNFIQLQEHGVNFFRNQDVKNNTIDKGGCAKISNEVYDKLTLKLQSNDILISRTGTLGSAGVVGQKHLPASANQNLAVLRNIQDMLPYYVSVVLCSKIGLLQINRHSTGNVQQWLNLEAIKGLKIPNTTSGFQKTIQKMVISSEELLSKSTIIFSSVEQLITDRCGFSIKKTTCENNSVKMLSDSLGISGRLDAEYYQEKYQAYETAIVSAIQGYTYIKNVFTPVKEKCQRNLSNYNYVEIGDIDIGTGCASFNIVNTNELPDNAKIMTQKGDLLVSTVRPNRGAVAILEKDALLVSGAFTVLRETGDYPKEVLQVLLRTSIYRDWLLRFNVGTSYPVIKDEDVLNIPIPLLEDNVKQAVVNKVNESASLRRQSKQLLEYAEQAVEMAIEQGEDAALAWLKDKVE